MDVEADGEDAATPPIHTENETIGTHVTAADLMCPDGTPAKLARNARMAIRKGMSEGTVNSILMWNIHPPWWPVTRSFASPWHGMWGE